MRHLFLDVDGCLSRGRYHNFDLKSLANLNRLINENGWNVVLSSGRSQPYLEALSQIVECGNFLICENGATVFDLNRSSTLFSEDTVNLASYVSSLAHSGIGEFEFEPGKSYTASFVLSVEGRRLSSCRAAELIEMNFPTPKGLTITYSNSAIDIIPESASKMKAAEFLVQYCDIDLDETYSFGDSENDLDLMAYTGHSGAPSNASDNAKAVADFVSNHEQIYGLIDYLSIIQSP